MLRHVRARGRGAGRDPSTCPTAPTASAARAQVACFGRDAATALQVWSGEHGYPGDGAYLDFHKKRFPAGTATGRSTHPQADLAHKQVYRPERGRRPGAAATPRTSPALVASVLSPEARHAADREPGGVRDVRHRAVRPLVVRGPALRRRACSI